MDGSKVIATAHVQHSQSISQAKIRQWFTAEQSGNMICAHCTCMAGLGAWDRPVHTYLILDLLQKLSNFLCTSLPCGCGELKTGSASVYSENVTASAMQVQ